MRVQVVEDNEALRLVACLEVELSEDLELAGSAADGQEAIDVARRERPDAILLDIDMPRMNGAEALPALIELVPDARIVVYTSVDCTATRELVLRSGAKAFVVKGTVPLREALDLLRESHSRGNFPA